MERSRFTMKKHANIILGKEAICHTLNQNALHILASTPHYYMYEHKVQINASATILWK